MKIVVDANVIFSVLRPNSASAYLFSEMDAEFYAPHFLEHELTKHKEECKEKAGLSEHEYELTMSEICNRIRFSKLEDYKKHLGKARQIVADNEDVEYIALALMLDAAVWSLDERLRQQNVVRVLNTKQILKKFLVGDL